MTDFVGLKEPTAVKLLIFVTYVTCSRGNVCTNSITRRKTWQGMATSLLPELLG